MNVADPGEARVAIISGGRLDEVYVERAGRSLAGNIYLGKVGNIEPSLQAAFVDIGQERNGFLHASDCMPPDGGTARLLHGRTRSDKDDDPEAEDREPPPGDGRKIETMLRKGQSLLVQVTKDGIGSKGPALTTHLSLPGRYLVLMPGLSRLGVSKKIVDEALRTELRQKLSELDPPPNLGFIARTACAGHPVEDLRRDMDFLVGLWHALAKRGRSASAPALIYQESDLVIRAVRDYLPPDTERVLVDSPAVLPRVTDFLELVCPEMLPRTALYAGAEPIFHHFGVEAELTKLGRRTVRLPSGGSLVIEQTEALVSVDVNTSGYRGQQGQAKAILQNNLEAAREVAQQLRLRDIGGLVIIDFVDMDEPDHCRQVERELRAALARDRARIFVTPMSQLGVIEMSRQRVRPGLALSTFIRCQECSGTGSLKSPESLGLDLLRQAKACSATSECRTLEAHFAPAVALQLANLYRRELLGLEDSCGLTIMIRGDAQLPPGRMRIVARTESGGQVFDRLFEEAD